MPDCSKVFDRRLLIFDVDGTLARSFTLRLLPGVKEFFEYLRRRAGRPALAIATNQGGVGLGSQRILEGARKGKYPSAAEIEARMRALTGSLGLGEEMRVYTSFRYQDKAGGWTPVPPGSESDPRWRQDWRKPGPGMLLQAMQDAGAAPEQALFVGDSPEDQAAALAAGCAFTWAEEFFQADWSGCGS